jgi:hypothetical protein
MLFGLNQNEFYTLVLTLLLVIIGLVSFHFYSYVSAKNGLNFGTGFGVSLLPNTGRQEEGFYY